ncbi:hypothetical protein Pfo_012368 [Paulownia fortunei]|nr:hypothetical protein Pfo_012368 [Paulownia fortunei]
MRKEIKMFELNLSVPDGGFHCGYEFPNIEKLLSRSHEVKSAFGSLRSLRLVDVDIEDEVVHYFLASCQHLEQLCISAAFVTKNLQVVDPLPILKSFGDIQMRQHPKSRNICYESSITKITNIFLSQLCQCRNRAIIAPPVLPQLYCLTRLEVYLMSQVGRSLLFFTSLIKASPHLHEFRIKIDYIVVRGWYEIRAMMLFPEVSTEEAIRFHHKNLKVVEMAGYIGCESEEKFILQLFKIAPSLEIVVIDTQSDYYDDQPIDWSIMETLTIFGKAPWRTGARTRMEEKEHAKHLEFSFPPKTVLVIT